MKEWKKPIIESIDVLLTRGGYKPNTSELVALNNMSGLKGTGNGSKIKQSEIQGKTWDEVRAYVLGLPGVSKANKDTIVAELDAIGTEWSNLNIS